MDDSPEADYIPGSQAPKIDNAAVYSQLEASAGNISSAARELGVSRRWLQGRIDKVPALNALVQDYREEIVDIAQDNVFADVRRNDPTANRFVLQTLGRSRGFGNVVEGNGKNGEIVVNIVRLSDAE
jgi:hypothetical protein